MKKLMFVLCLFVFPLTLASDTQTRYNVHVSVEGEDRQAVREIEIYLKRELRLLGDVNIVDWDDDWKYVINVFALTLETADGRETGNYAIAHYTGYRLAKFHYRLSTGHQLFPSVHDIRLGASYYSRKTLPEYCIVTVGSFEKNILEIARKVNR